MLDRVLTLDRAVLLLAIVVPHSKGLTNFALGLVVVVGTRDWIVGSLVPRATPLDRALAFWIGAELLATLVSIDPFEGLRNLKGLSVWVIYYAVAWTAASSLPVIPANAGVQFLEKLQNAWLISGAAAAARGLVQLAAGIDLVRPFNVSDRAFFNSHLAFGHSMALFLTVALLRLGGGASRSDRLWLVPSVALFAIGLVVSEGRGPWLAFLAIVLLVFRQPRVLQAVALVVVLQLGWIASRPDGIAGFYRSYAATDPSDAVGEEALYSNLWRLAMWRGGLLAFSERPVAGKGTETMGELSRDFAVPFPDFGVAHLHSNYFEALATRGFIGLAALFYLMIEGLRATRRAARGADSPIVRAAALGGFGAFVAHAVHGLTQFTLGSAWIQSVSSVALGMAIAPSLGTVPSPSVATLQGRLPLVRRRVLPWILGSLAVVFLAAPRLAREPWLSFVIAALAGSDLVIRWRRAEGDVASTACALTLAFVLLAAALLLLPLPGGSELALRAASAAAAAFGLSVAIIRVIAWQSAKGADKSPERESS